MTSLGYTILSLVLMSSLSVFGQLVNGQSTGEGTGEPVAKAKLSDAFKGTVEIWREGVWSKVCAEVFTDLEARVVCKELGFTGNSAKATSGSDQSSKLIFIWESVRCLGDESRILLCNVQSSFCPEMMAASVHCFGKMFPNDQTTQRPITSYQPSNSTYPSYNATNPTYDTTYRTANTTYQSQDSTFPLKNGTNQSDSFTYPSYSTNKPSYSNQYQPNNTTYQPYNTTYSSYNTTYPHRTATYSPYSKRTKSIDNNSSHETTRSTSEAESTSTEDNSRYTTANTWKTLATALITEDPTVTEWKKLIDKINAHKKNLLLRILFEKLIESVQEKMTSRATASYGSLGVTTSNDLTSSTTTNTRDVTKSQTVTYQTTKMHDVTTIPITELRTTTLTEVTTYTTSIRTTPVRQTRELPRVGCRSDYNVIKPIWRCYKLHKNQAIAQIAAIRCRREGGRLVSMETNRELETLGTFISRSTGNANIWTSGRVRNGRLVWSNQRKSHIHSNNYGWYPGYKYPYRGRSGSHCIGFSVKVRKRTVLFDFPCDTPHLFMCEQPMR